MLSEILKILTSLTHKKDKTLSLAKLRLKVKNYFEFSDWGRIRMRIVIILMPVLIRIRTWIGINVGIQIQIDIKTMPIHSTALVCNIRFNSKFRLPIFFSTYYIFCSFYQLAVQSSSVSIIDVFILHIFKKTLFCVCFLI